MKEHFKLIEETKNTLIFESSNTYKGIAEVVEKDTTPIIVTGIDTSILTFKASLLKTKLSINQYFITDRIIAIYSYGAIKFNSKSTKNILDYETITFVKTITREGILRYYAIVHD